MSTVDKVFKAVETMARYPDKDGGDATRLREMANQLRTAATYAESIAAMLDAQAST